MAQATTVTRRDILRSSLAAGAALAVPACVFASEAAAKGEKALRWGIIGTGARATRAHIPAIRSFADQMQILAVCDVMEDHLAAGAKRAGGAVQRFTDYHKLLADKEINAVLIATPNLLHKEMLLAALDAGKHVMCEKPMAVSIEECRAMRAAQEKHPEPVVLYAMQLRYAGVWSTFRREIEKGTIGKPKHLLLAEFRGDWNRGDVWQYDDPKLGRVNWRLSQAATGGTLNEKVCHYFDILHWMIGSTPQRVSCSGGVNVYRGARDTWDHASTTLTYADGVQATHSLCMFAPHRLDLQVIGDEASLTFGRGEESLTLQSRKGKPRQMALPEEIRHGERGSARGMETAVVRMYEDFLDCVRHGKQPWMDAAKAMPSSQTAFLAEVSNEKKMEVAWDELG